MRAITLASGLLALIFLVGCAEPSTSETTATGETTADVGPVASEEEIKAFVESVGEALVAKDWDALHAKTSSELNSETSPEQLGTEYQSAADQISADFEPVRYEVYTGNLPLDAKEAEDVYGITRALSPSSWRTWTIISLYDGDSDEGPVVDARFLVIQQGADLLIGHIEFARGY